ncbi:MAG: SCO family protein [Chloroflexota bacterium]
MNKSSWIKTIIILFLILSTLSACSVFKPAFKADIIKPVTAAPEISLTDQNGNPFQLSGTQGSIVLLFFGFTNCVEECPLTLAHIKTALESLGNNAKDVRVVFVSTDPVRDTPMALQDFLGKFDPSYIGIPGTLAELTKVWNDYGIVVLDGGETHSSFTYVIDRSGNLRLKIEAESDPKAMASDLKILLAEK